MKTLFKTISAGIILSLSVLCLTASTTPGFDENGNDINECLEIGTCPEGYTCINTPGSFYCKGEGIENLDINLTLQESSGGLFYSVRAKCISLGSCTAKCTKCKRKYSKPVIGKATSINGLCICGNMIFEGQ